MKRVGEPEEWNEFVKKIKGLKRRDIEAIRNYQGTVYVIVYGPGLGFYKTFDDLKKARGHVKGSVYKRFARADEAITWFESALALPSLPYAPRVELSVRCYDVTQERDTYAAVSIYYGHGDERNITAQANTKTDTLDMYFVLLTRILDNTPEFPIRITCDSYHIVYGINYGLWNWPKHDFCSPPTLGFMNLRDRIKGNGIELIWSDTTTARKLVESNCEMQYSNEIPSFYTLWKKACYKQCITWLMCARRLNINKDISKVIGLYLLHQLYDYKCNNVHFYI